MFYGCRNPWVDFKYKYKFIIFSTHILTVLTTCVILHAEQRKQHISPVGEIFLI